LVGGGMLAGLFVNLSKREGAVGVVSREIRFMWPYLGRFNPGLSAGFRSCY
jgi:hypothetical protein